MAPRLKLGSHSCVVSRRAFLAGSGSGSMCVNTSTLNLVKKTNNLHCSGSGVERPLEHVIDEHLTDMESLGSSIDAVHGLQLKLL